ncbi:MAG: hypothetical protein GKS06_06530 [Acidobacteria bacterium]|nr:hypothetical protein [Acidobacteriota bacterium]
MRSNGWPRSSGNTRVDTVTEAPELEPLEDPSSDGETVDAFASSAEATPAEPPGGGMFYCLTATVLAWLIPGAGHAFVGQWRRAIVFGGLISGLFVGGLALDGRIYRIEEDDVLSYAASLGASGVGGFYVVGHALGYGDGDEQAAYHEYGSTFTLVAGLLNLLIILDAFDHALLRHHARRAKTPAAESL